MIDSSPISATRRALFTELHGETLQDDYAWMRERESSDVLDYLQGENAQTQSAMEPTRELQETLYQEMKARLQEDDTSVPVQIDDYCYYHRTEEGKQYSVHCRRRDSSGADEQILLDLNALAGDGDFLSLGVYRISPDHRLLAYSLDRDGSERYVLRIKDLITGEDLPEEITNTAQSAEWLNDSQTLLYSTRDDAQRPHRSYCHRLGDDPSQDQLLFEESDERFFLSMEKTRSRRFIILRLGTHTMTELHVLDIEDAEKGFRLLAARRSGIEFSVDHHGDRFFLLTNLGAADFRLLEVAIHDLRESGWVEALVERSQVVIEGVACFQEFLVLEVRKEGLRGLEIYSLAGSAESLSNQKPSVVDFDEPVYTVQLIGNANFSSLVLRFSYSSFLTPRSIVDYHMADGSRELRKRDRVAGFEPQRYVSERLLVQADDGAQIPVSLVRPKDVLLDGSAPLLLYGYGSYGSCIEPRFSNARLSLLDRGLIYAIAHVRGGGAYGRAWYEAGKLAHKPSTFSDFEAVAEALIERRYTTPRRLAIRGASAGGLLIGAVLNRRPELFHAALAEVPFVDVLNTMLDPTIPLTVIEYDEWGNPQDDEEAFRCIRSYSPYDNVRSVSYPHLLVTAGLHDPRVQYWEPAKWVAKLKQIRCSDSMLLLKTDMGSGHGGASGRYNALELEAFKFAFLIRALATERAGLSSEQMIGVEAHD